MLRAVAWVESSLVIHLFISERDGIFSDLLVLMDDLNYVEHYKQVQWYEVGEGSEREIVGRREIVRGR